MSQNLHQVFIANPITSNAGTDLMYFGQSPYGVGDDAAMLYSNFAAQFAPAIVGGYVPIAGGTMTGGLLFTGQTPINDISQIRSAYIYLGVGVSQTISPIATNFFYEFVVAGVDLNDTSGLALYDDGFFFTLKNISGGNCTFTPKAGEFIDGAASLTIANQQGVTIVKGTTQWCVVSQGGTGVLSPLTTKGDLYTYSTVNTRLAVGSTNGQMLQVNSVAATGLSWSTATYPSVATTTGSMLYADGTNWIASTSLWVNTVGAVGKMIRSNGTSNTYTTATYPDVATTTGSMLYANGTNWIASTSLWANTVGAVGKIIRSDGTTNTYSTATYPDTAGTAGNLMVSDGTNFVSSAQSSVIGLTALNYLLMGG